MEYTSVEQYLESVSEDKKEAVALIRKSILENIPHGFEETISYNMIGYVVPKSLYPQGYHCNKSLPLPFINIAAQKNFIALYHMGIYADNELMQWFVKEYENCNIGKLDIGKSCIRFKKVDKIPYELIAKLAQKYTAEDWIKLYEASFLRKG
jgi:uncharacterized protein YdhG (YjbR/CyaY superfamily)